ncbi:putative ferric-chelate reductase 1 homolog isoform X1 [Haliotis rufescens]|uniref:putative ferric-chelate reductase 1 homolog isoform X1 n=1 Tax=Haliotis rufescens TaxID=6454 RepID=UPI00201F7318|nr:putative ferric-chelate reductase 1 homolog isoform X1 [Haliotis rufescens]
MEMLPLLACVLHATLIAAYPSGAPNRACPGLLPFHRGTAPQVTNAPYRIGVSSLQYTPNMPITVTIHADDQSLPFMAFLLQARVKGNNSTSVGQFSQPPVSTKLLTCFSSGDSITHSSAQPRVMLQMTWMPPTRDMGQIEILGTVAQSKQIYFGVLSSGALSFSGSSSPPAGTSAPNPEGTAEGAGMGGAATSPYTTVVTTLLSAALMTSCTLLMR